MKLTKLTTASAFAIAAMLLSAPANAADCKGQAQSACEASDSCSWVKAFTRSNGEKVKAFCRSKPGNGSSKSSKSSKSSSSKSSDSKTTKKSDSKSSDSKTTKKSDSKTTKKSDSKTTKKSDSKSKKPKSKSKAKKSKATN